MNDLYKRRRNDSAEEWSPINLLRRLQHRQEIARVQQARVAARWQNVQTYHWQNVQKVNISWAGGLAVGLAKSDVLCEVKIHKVFPRPVADSSNWQGFEYGSQHTDASGP